MARADGKKEIQHYVPQVLLKSFRANVNGGSAQVHVYDKHAKRSFLTSVANIAAERSFYEFAVDGRSHSVEGHLGELETKFAPLATRILQTRTLACLSSEDRVWLAAFVAAQLQRTKNFRETILEVDRSISERITAMGGNPSDVEGFRPLGSEDELKAFSTDLMLSSLKENAGYIVSKTWLLFEAPKSGWFWIGDHPVVMHNDLSFGPYGNLGLAVRGIQLYIPLSPQLSLGFWCPSLMKERKQELAEAKRIVNAAKVERVIGAAPRVAEIDALIAQYGRLIPELEAFVAAADEGVAIGSTDENVEFHNSLQARQANQFVMSPRKTFGLVERMLREFPRSKFGLRMEALNPT